MGWGCGRGGGVGPSEGRGFPWCVFAPSLQWFWACATSSLAVADAIVFQMVSLADHLSGPPTHVKIRASFLGFARGGHPCRSSTCAAPERTPVIGSGKTANLSPPRTPERRRRSLSVLEYAGEHARQPAGWTARARCSVGYTSVRRGGGARWRMTVGNPARVSELPPFLSKGYCSYLSRMRGILWRPGSRAYHCESSEEGHPKAHLSP